MQFENTITIDKPVDNVFAYLLDVEKLPEWNYAISRTSQVTPGVPRIGTKYRQERTLPRPMVEELEITGLKTNSYIEIAGGFGPFPHGISRYELVALSPDKTLVRNHIELRAESALRLLAPLATSRIRAAVAQNLLVLKSNVENT